MDLFLSFPGAQSPSPPSSLAQDVCSMDVYGRGLFPPLSAERGAASPQDLSVTARMPGTSRCRRKARTWTICWFIDRTQPETGKFYSQWSATGVRKGTVVTINNSGRVRGLTRPCRGLQACGEEARDVAPAFPGCVLMPPVAAPPPRLPRSRGVWTPPRPLSESHVGEQTREWEGRH